MSTKPGVSVVIPTNKKGLRNGNWRKLRFLDKALYRAVMGYARYVLAGDGAVKMKIGKYLN